MVIYIITKCGRTLKDEAIQYLLEKIALAEKESNYIYRCPATIGKHKDLSNELLKINHEYKIIFYENMDNWQVLPEVAKAEFIQIIRDPHNQDIPLNEILTYLVEAQ